SSALSALSGQIRTLRDMMVSLHPPVLDERGLEAALTSQARRLAESDIACSIRADVDVRPDPTAEMILFRVAQEAISNVIKHSGAAHVEIALHAWPRGTL